MGDQQRSYDQQQLNAAGKTVSSGGKRMSTGVIFFKTKLCSRFKHGTCPYTTNCNFAHGVDDLRKPPPGWEEYVNPPQPDGVRDGAGGSSQKLLRPCKNFFTEGICPYGERCIFSHEDPAAKPSSVPVSTDGTTTTAKPSNWKTRLCNKWETTGYCPFGEKCHFAHGATELQISGTMDAPVPVLSVERKAPNASTSLTVDAAAPVQLKSGSSKTAVWRGPTTGISTVYGDWLEDESEEDDAQEAYSQ